MKKEYDFSKARLRSDRVKPDGLLKKPLADITIDGNEFKIPRAKAEAILELVKGLQIGEESGFKVIYKDENKSRTRGAIYLRGTRLKKGLSQKELGKLTGILGVNVSKYENGTRKITKKVALKFGKALNIDPERLLKE